MPDPPDPLPGRGPACAFLAASAADIVDVSADAAGTTPPPPLVDAEVADEGSEVTSIGIASSPLDGDVPPPIAWFQNVVLSS